MYKRKEPTFLRQFFPYWSGRQESNALRIYHNFPAYASTNSTFLLRFTGFSVFFLNLILRRFCKNRVKIVYNVYNENHTKPVHYFIYINQKIQKKEGNLQMNSNVNYTITKKLIRDEEWGSAMHYGIKAETDKMSVAIYDISTDIHDVERCLKQIREDNIDPSQLYDAVDTYIDLIQV